MPGQGTAESESDVSGSEEEYQDEDAQDGDEPIADVVTRVAKREQWASPEHARVLNALEAGHITSTSELLMLDDWSDLGLSTGVEEALHEALGLTDEGDEGDNLDTGIEYSSDEDPDKIVYKLAPHLLRRRQVRGISGRTARSHTVAHRYTQTTSSSSTSPLRRSRRERKKPKRLRHEPPCESGLTARKRRQLQLDRKANSSARSPTAPTQLAGAATMAEPNGSPNKSGLNALVNVLDQHLSSASQARTQTISEDEDDEESDVVDPLRLFTSPPVSDSKRRKTTVSSADKQSVTDAPSATSAKRGESSRYKLVPYALSLLLHRVLQPSQHAPLNFSFSATRSPQQTSPSELGTEASRLAELQTQKQLVERMLSSRKNNLDMMLRQEGPGNTISDQVLQGGTWSQWLRGSAGVSSHASAPQSVKAAASPSNVTNQPGLGSAPKIAPSVAPIVSPFVRPTITLPSLLIAPTLPSTRPVNALAPRFEPNLTVPPRPGSSVPWTEPRHVQDISASARMQSTGNCQGLGHVRTIPNQNHHLPKLSHTQTRTNSANIQDNTLRVEPPSPTMTSATSAQLHRLPLGPSSSLPRGSHFVPTQHSALHKLEVMPPPSTIQINSHTTSQHNTGRPRPALAHAVLTSTTSTHHIATSSPAASSMPPLSITATNKPNKPVPAQPA